MMNKSIVVCVDGSPESRAAVDYIGLVFGKSQRLTIDLLHILPDLPPLFLDPGENMVEMMQVQEFAEQLQTENRKKAVATTDEAKEILVNAGVTPGRIRSLIKGPSIRVAEQILEFEGKDGCDVIVLGRHGANAVEEFFMGSVTHKVLQHAETVPICIVHGQVESRKVLVPVVSSPNSKRVLDEIAWLLDEAGPMEVMILHVAMPLLAQEFAYTWTGLADMASTAEQRMMEEAEEMLSQAKTYLMERGVPAFSIKTHVEVTASGVARAILKEAREGGYGSILIGRRGISRTKQFLFGSVSNKVVQHARDTAVWVIS
jgi:nucleotide-binding universal stress UspA family protein